METDYSEGRWYTEDGRQVIVESTLPGDAGFVVREILEHEDREPWVGSKVTVEPRVYRDEPPMPALHDGMEALQQRIAEAKTELASLQVELARGQRDKAAFDKALEGSQAGKAMAAILCGTAWVVGYDDGVPVAASMNKSSHLAETASGDRYGSREVSVGLVLRRDGPPIVRLNQMATLTVYATQEEAEDVAHRSRCKAMENIWRRDAIAKWCAKHDKPIPAEVLEEIRQKDLEALESERCKLEASLDAVRTKIASAKGDR